ncbi:hypothetical protein [Arthrobacter sp. zg-Y769]|nr:hypothetical protein [Arthrobacter sp. zg-Y769]MCC9206113.1 hypothetical protein [Arthrobacter sp. zg-Y769]
MPSGTADVLAPSRTASSAAPHRRQPGRTAVGPAALPSPAAVGPAR